MKFPIDTQFNLICTRYQTLKHRAAIVKNIERVEWIEQDISNLKDAYSAYKVATKTSWGYIRSFFPFTSAYSYRVNFDHRIAPVWSKLNQFKEEVEKAEKSQARRTTRSQSAPELPKCYKSPINKLKAQDKTFNHAEGNQDGYRNQRAGISI